MSIDDCPPTLRNPPDGLVLDDVVRSGPDLEHDVSRAAGAMADAGLGVGDRVALLLRNDVAFIEASLAASRLGAVPVPLNWHASGAELAHILRDSEARLLIAHCDLYDQMAQHVPTGLHAVVIEPSVPVTEAHGLDLDGRHGTWNDWLADAKPMNPTVTSTQAGFAPDTLSYTSGTTGRPKGVRRASKATPFAAQMAAAMGMRPGLRHLVTGPLYHAAPNALALFAAKSGGLVVIQPRFDAKGLLELVERHQIDYLIMVPTMFVRLLDLPKRVRARYDLSSIRYAVHGAGPCPPSVKRAMIDWWGPVIYEYYGGTEAGTATLCSSADALGHPGTVGRALPGVSIHILTEHGGPAAVGEIGEIYIKNEAMPEFEYVGSAATARDEVVRDGFVTQGDVGYLDDDGYLYLSGRKREMIVSGGVNIYTIELENELATMPGIRVGAAFPVPDDELGEAVGVAVELDGTHRVDAQAVRNFLTASLGRLKAPRVVEFAEHLSLDDAGKVFKGDFTRRYWPQNGSR